MPQTSTLTAIPFLINDLRDDSIYHIAIYANDTTLLGKLKVFHLITQIKPLLLI